MNQQIQEEPAVQPPTSSIDQADSKSPTILLTGGGTAGHITPLIAVAHELKRLQPNARLIYIGEKFSKFSHVAADESIFDERHAIFAGKFRRYHGESWFKRISDVRTMLWNARDILFLLLGIVQSFWLVARLKPDVILLKGGFVGVPVGLAAAALGKQFITHDSDALPGLANRIVGRWAKWHATGMPARFYRYSNDSIRHVGVLVGEQYQPVSNADMLGFRQELNLPSEATVLFVTGGSNGAQVLNRAMTELVPNLLQDEPDLHIIHQVGQGNANVYGSYSHERLQILEYLKGMYRYSGASDVIVTRAGANALAEFGVQGKACVVVPNPLLTGGHQLKNAEDLVGQGAVIAIDEATFKAGSTDLEIAIRKLLDSPETRLQLGRRFQQITVPDAAKRLAQLLIGVVDDVNQAPDYGVTDATEK